jgi:NAD(P)-dependent dehydrogenase (short-subunit alcohol dehydrogenase family)
LLHISKGQNIVKNLQGKVAVITGAASGIGRAMTDRFIAAGMKIVLADVDEVKLRNVEAELTENGADVFPVTVDVSLGESWPARRWRSTARHMCSAITLESLVLVISGPGQ